MASYTFLQLAQKVRSKCRIPGSGPVAVTGQTGDYQRVLDWTNEAYLDILRMYEAQWYFLRKSATCVTDGRASGKYMASDFGLSDFGQWDLDYQNGRSFRNYPTSSGLAGEMYMDVITYDEWRDTYLFGAYRSTFTRPQVVAMAPDNGLCVGPLAAANYTLVGDYFSIPTEMVTGTDTPVIPSQYQMAIVYRAMMLYGVSEAAPEVYTDGQNSFDVIVRQMMATQLPPIQMAGSLC